jgi:hypothetical protein
MVDFGGPRPYPAYLREHSPDYGTYRGKPRAREGAEPIPTFVRASDLPRPLVSPKPPVAPRPTIEIAHEEAETTASPEAGRAWASGQLVFNAGQFESARGGFADYTRDVETAEELRARVNCNILEDLEEKVPALRQLHAKLRDRECGAVVLHILDPLLHKGPVRPCVLYGAVGFDANVWIHNRLREHALGSRFGREPNSYDCHRYSEHGLHGNGDY